MSSAARKGMATTVPSVDTKKLSFVTVEGDPSRSRRKQVEKAVRVQAARASAAARKATIARKEAAKLNDETSLHSDVVITPGRETAQRRKEPRSRRTATVAQHQLSEAPQPTYNLPWHAHDGTLALPSQCAPSRIAEKGSSHRMHRPANVVGRSSWPKASPTATPSSAGQTWSHGQINDDYDLQMWHMSDFTNPPAYQNRSLLTTSDTLLTGWCPDFQYQTPFDAYLMPSDHVPSPLLHDEEESPASSTSFFGREPSFCNDDSGTPGSPIDPRSCTYNRQRYDSMTQTIMSSRLLDACHLIVPPLLNLFHAVAAYNSDDACAVSYARQLLHQASTDRPSDQELCQMDLDHADAQVYIWSGLLSYVGCLCETELVMPMDHSLTSAAAMINQICYEMASIPLNMPLGTRYDGLLLWSTVSRYMLYHNAETDTYSVLKTLLKGLSICSFQELKALMIDFAYHPALLDGKLAALWAIVADDPFQLDVSLSLY